MTTESGALLTTLWPFASFASSSSATLPGKTIRLAFYFFTIVLGGLVHDYRLDADLLHIFKYRNPNLVHIVFVKKGWPYVTFCVHTWLTIISCLLLIHQPQPFTHIICYFKRKYFRFTLFIIIWFISQEVFDYYLLTTSHCDSYENFDQFDCTRRGFKWLAGFDISGHVFVLVLSNIVLLEESRLIERWLSTLVIGHCDSSNKLDSPEVARRELKCNSPEMELIPLYSGINLAHSPDLKFKKKKPFMSPLSPVASLQWSDEFEFDSSIDISNELYPLSVSLFRCVLLRIVPGARFVVSTLEVSYQVLHCMAQHCRQWMVLHSIASKTTTLDSASLRPLVFLTWLLVRAISLVYDVMLLQTIFFYHTTSEKVISFCWTLFCCRMIYQIAPSELPTDSDKMFSLISSRYHS